MPGPALVGLLALTALLLGIRGRRPSPSSGSTAPRLPVLFRLARRCPAPAGAVRFVQRRQSDGAIAAAGLAEVLDGHALARSRIGLGVVGLAVGGLLAVMTPAASVIGLPLAGMGLFAPSVMVAARARRRRAELVRDLPDLIDMVVLCTDSGLPLESSLRVAVARFSGVLADEMRHTLARLDLGTPRRAAYRALAERMGVQELTTLVGAILQAEELGTPISAVLGRQAGLLRANRRQAIRDHAARAAPQVQLVVAMIMVPGALLIVVGVMVLKLIGDMGVVVGGAP